MKTIPLLSLSLCAFGGSALAAETPASAAPGSGSQSKKPPNVLLLFSDQHHAGVLGCAGHPDVKTPNLDRLAADGVRFSRAYCQDAVCGPSRASLMTGLYPRTLGVLDNGEKIAKAVSHVPLPTLMKQSGYTTACFGKQHLASAMSVTWDTAFGVLSGETPTGYWEWIEKKGLFVEFLNDWLAEFGDRLPGVGFNYSAPLQARISRLPADATMEAYVTGKTIEFLQQRRPGDKPFFCWTSFYRPHQPYTPTARWADLYDPEKIHLPGSLRQPPDQLPPFLRNWRVSDKRPINLAEAARDEGIYRRYIAYYYALVSEIDDDIGRIMETLRQTGLDENTLVIYTSDHGDFVGHHGMMEKCHQGHSVYEDTLRVPLIFYWKGRILSGKEVSDLVELVDIYPTLAEFCGIAPPPSVKLAGRSLVPALTEGKPVGRRYAIAENYSQISVITDRYKLGHWIEPPMAGRDFRSFGDLLFDRQSDPLELTNLAGKPELAEVEAQLRKDLAEWDRATPADGKRFQVETMRASK
jgi:arylsulfatase A-like enzyme